MTTAPDSHDLRRVYVTRAASTTGPAVSQIERALIAETFLEVGPNAPTLCGAWDAHHLAAHIVLREENPITSAQTTFSPRADDAVDALVARTAYEQLVEQVRSGPPSLSLLRIPGAERRANTLELAIHHEDVRRAQPDWTTRDLPLWAQTQIWEHLRWFAKFVTRQAPVPMQLRRSDTGEQSVARKGDRPVIVTGPPLELALFVYGRPQVAGIELEGDDDAVARLRGARFRV